jgi:hypothetical protein
MTTKPTGRSAFPLHVLTSHSSEHEWGMTLRDYFAGQALVGILANGHSGAFFDEDGKQVGDTGSYAYEIADSMLKARNQCDS